MNVNNTHIQILEGPKNLSKDGRTGVSLHCHTQYSKEMLDFIPFYADKIPVVRHIWKRECRRYELREGKPPNFNTGYWQPPLTGHQVFAMEQDQMRRSGIDAIVSITDHDTITASREINLDIDNSVAPVSMEWTVPFGRAYFHLGIHNMPPDRADDITRQLLDFTFAGGVPDNERLHEIFAMIDDIPQMLIVFNHPVWDIEMIGQTAHDALLEDFIAEHGVWMHAIEINGFRPWSENEASMAIAERLGLPMVSGGDRHCLHSNTMINVTGATTFAEFVDEVRVDKHSSVVVFPEYREPLVARQIGSMAQIMGHYPDFPESRRRWFDRVYFDAEDGTGVRSLTDHWDGNGPVWHRWAVGILNVLSHKSLRPIYRLLDDPKDAVPRENARSERRPVIRQKPLIAER